MHHTIILNQQNNSKNVCNDYSLESLKGVEANICGVLFVIIPCITHVCEFFVHVRPQSPACSSGRAFFFFVSFDSSIQY